MTVPREPDDIWPHSVLCYTEPPEVSCPDDFPSCIEPPREGWMNGLPIGNGRLAAMVCGSATRDRLALNHEWLWRGKYRHRTIPQRHEKLRDVRSLFFEGKYVEAARIANDLWGTSLGAEGDKQAQTDCYQPAGDLIVSFAGEVNSYRRSLDLDRAVVDVCHEVDSAVIRREYVALSSGQAIAARLFSEDTEFCARIELSRVEDPECELRIDVSGNELMLTGRYPEGLRFAVCARVVTDGLIEVVGKAIQVRARQAIVLIDIRLSHEDQDVTEEARRGVCNIDGDWADLIACHVAEHRKLYRRSLLDIGEDHSDCRTVSDRLQNIRQGQTDAGLYCLYANFGRYLLITSSAGGTLPPNLQGKWNEALSPPWMSDYHININLQMNYWPAEPFGLAECIDPLIRFIEMHYESGAIAARNLYDCKGIFIPHSTDVWCRATPEAHGWAVWSGGAAWLAQHLWWRWEYSRDTGYLRRCAYPFMKAVAQFYEDYLVSHPTEGYLVAVPSQSPENHFSGGSEPVSLCVSATMDILLCEELLTNVVAAAEILGIDGEARERWNTMLLQLPPYKVGRFGQLQEWLEDFEEAEPGHRHVSHLYGVYPGESMMSDEKTEFRRAVQISLERRLAHGGGSNGWGRAWVAALWARLGDGEEAYEHLMYLLSNFVSESLLGLHPPGIFQIDGNLGGTAAVVEMLLQSYGGILHILPSLPRAWPKGKVLGLRGRGGFVVDIEWADGNPEVVRIHSKLGLSCRVRCRSYAEGQLFCEGPMEHTETSQGEIAFNTTAGKTYEFRW